jgi:hypothetical protein
MSTTDTEVEVKAEHSLLPWTWLPDDGQFIVDAKGNTVGEIPCQGCNPADGEFMVTAVNSYEANLRRIEVLTKALEFAVRVLSHSDIAGSTCAPVLQQARKALASTER